jgi:uncharacterized protein (TIGR00730 family)
MVKRYKLKDDVLNTSVNEIVEKAEIKPDQFDSVSDLISTSLAMGMQETSQRDMIIASASLREIYRTFLVFSNCPEKPRVSVFGSARTKPDDMYYELCFNFCKKIADKGWMIVSGAGPGIMEAAILGAGPQNSFGVSIKLPFEPEPIEAIKNSPYIINYRYFFTRKLAFMKEVQAFVLFPGGFGTMDELFELLTLVHTGKSAPAPIVLVEKRGGVFWENTLSFIRDNLLAEENISPEDLNLVSICYKSDEVLETINNFYKVYHSIRFVNKELVMRLKSPLTEEFCKMLSEKYEKLIVEGSIEIIKATEAEVKSNDLIELPRIKFKFDRHKWALLKMMIDDINSFEG